MIIKFFRPPTFANFSTVERLYGNGHYTSKVSYWDEVGNVLELRHNGHTIFKCYESYRDHRDEDTGDDSFTNIEPHIDLIKDGRKLHGFCAQDMAIFLIASYANTHYVATLENLMVGGKTVDSKVSDSLFDMSKRTAMNLFWKVFSDNFGVPGIPNLFPIRSTYSTREDYLKRLLSLTFDAFGQYFLRFPLTPASNLPDFNFALAFMEYVMSNYYLLITTDYSVSYISVYNEFDRLVNNLLRPDISSTDRKRIFSNKLEDGSFNIDDSRFLSFNVRF